MSRPSLDWTDEAAVREWLSNLRVAFADADAVTADMLRPLRQRELGHVQHRNMYGDAKKSILHLLEYAGAPAEGGKRAG
ncbi:MAG: hypothetical protein QM820_09270 [Minicystis sp.]